MKTNILLLTLLLFLSSPSLASRTPYATERLELAAYQVWSVSVSADGCWSVYVVDPDGYIHHLLPGDYIGRKGGKVDTIDDHGMVVVELIPNGKGGWKERRVRLDIPTSRQQPLPNVGRRPKR